MGSMKYPALRLLGVSTVVLLTTCTDDRGPLEPGPTEPSVTVISQPPTGAEIRLARVMEPGEIGVRNPAGLAFSPASGTLLVTRLPDAVAASTTDIDQVTLDGDPAVTVQIGTGVTEPVNMAFDASADRLLIFESPTDELIEIRAKPDGSLDPQTIDRFDALSFGVENPRGMTVDQASGRLFILDSTGRRIISVEQDSRQGFEEAVISEIDLRKTGLSNLRGLALHPTFGTLYTLDPSRGELHELTRTGEIVATHDVSEFGFQNTQGMTFGPSGDSTDDPDEWSLYIADSGEGSGAAEGGSIAEVSFDRAADALAAEILATVTGSLIQTIDTWQFAPPSPDPAGITYLTHLDHLLIGDSEVNEMSLYAGANLFEISLSGSVLDTYTTLAYSGEPTGITLNPANKHLFISDDNADQIFEIDPGPDEIYNTADDVVTSFATDDFGSDDPEGLTYDPVQGVLFIVDGVDSEVYRVSPGGNGVFDGVPPTGDDQVTSFDTETHDLVDPEGIAYDSDFGHLYIVGKPATTVFHVTTSGALLRTLDISAASARKPAGLAYAPGSLNPDQMNLWIVDRRVDNVSDPNENDGQAYEFSLPLLGGNILPTVTISEPAGGSRISEGTPVTFTGTATDAEDGDLTAALQWTSNQDGPIGSGGSFATSTLSVGTHTITASVDDSGGLQGSDQVTVTVESSDPSVPVFNETFEATGYDEIWSEGETLGTGVTLDEDYSTSSVTGAPSDWGSQSLQIVLAAGEDSYVEHDYAGSSYAESYMRVEFIVGSDDLVDGDVTHFVSVRGPGSEKMYQFLFARAGGQPYLTTQVFHDGTSNIYNMVISLNTRYRAEMYWSATKDEWEFRVDGNTRASGSLTGPAVDWELARFRLGDIGGQQDAAATVYVDNMAFSTASWVGGATAPTASFTWVATDLTVDFTDTSTDGDGTVTGWSWDFGDGASSPVQNPQHTYAAAGVYSVVLTVTDNDDATDNSTQTVTPTNPGEEPGTVEVRVAASTDDAEENASGSVGVTSSDLELVFDSSDQTVGMRFNALTIPHGATITGAYAQFTVDEANSGATSLVIEGEAADNAPTFSTSSFNISSRSTTASSVSWSPVPWTAIGQAGPDQRTPNIASVIQEIVNRPGWSSGNSLVIIVSGTGERTAESFNGASASAPLLHVDYIIGASQAPMASYTWSATDLTVDFTDTSTDSDGTVTGWSWDFGDGQTSTVQNPQHTYVAAGDYTVTLSVTDDDGAASVTPASQSVSPTAPNQAPTASYTWSATDLTVDFTDTSVDADGTVTGWSWDFGDGASSPAQNPQHTYVAAGDYTVTLSVTDDDGATDPSAPQTVTVTAAAETTVSAISPSSVVAGSTTAMTVTGSGFDPGATVTFENGTTGPPPEIADVVVVDAGIVTVTVTTKTGGPKRDRLWDVRVSNPDGSSGVLEGRLTITQ